MLARHGWRKVVVRHQAPRCTLQTQRERLQLPGSAAGACWRTRMCGGQDQPGQHQHACYLGGVLLESTLAEGPASRNC